MRRERQGLHRGVIAALGLMFAMGTVGLTAGDARADDARRTGVVIDSSGVHFYMQGDHHYYADRRYPDARRFFSRNEHYRKSVRLERERDRRLDNATRWLTSGDLERARKAFDAALRAETRRQRQLVRLERDRERFEKRARRHRRDHRRHAWWRR